MDRPSNSFVIFQMGDGSSDNIVLNLPTVLLGNNNAIAATNTTTSIATNGTTPATSNEASANSNSTSATLNTNTVTAATISNQVTDISENRTTSTAEQAAPPGTLQNNATANTGNSTQYDPDVQRNMLVSVSYIYSNPGATTNTANNDANSRSGSLLLNVPDIPANRNDAQFDAMVEFAASIALTAIAATGLRRQRGITKENFEKFPIKKKSDLEDSTCPICFDEYDDDFEEKKEQWDVNKGKRDREEDDDQTHRKMRKTEPQEVSQASEGTSTSETAPLINAQNSNHAVSTDQPSGETVAESYNHEPIELPCHHRFGRSCAFEWLKTNNTCPLCRQVVHTDFTNTNIPDRINLPNIGSLINPGSRDRPLVIFLDRNTNTLTTRSEANDSTISTPPTSASNTSSNNHPFPLGTNRHPITSRLLQNLTQSNNLTDSIFTTGVASRRTRAGVETVNSDSQNIIGSNILSARPNAFQSFYEESRRLVQDRLNMRNRDEGEIFDSNQQGDTPEFQSTDRDTTNNDTTSTNGEQSESNDINTSGNSNSGDT